MRIITLNLNGIRSAYNKGLLEWFGKQTADILCVQELKAQAADMTPDMLAPLGYHGYFHYAEKKGYSGVGIYCKRKPDNVIVGLNISRVRRRRTLHRSAVRQPQRRVVVPAFRLQRRRTPGSEIQIHGSLHAAPCCT